MTLSVSVYEEVNVVDVVVAIQFVMIFIPSFYTETVITAKEVATILVDNNSPPFQDTLAVAIQEEVLTKEALS